jgi:hypothetical protein
MHRVLPPKSLLAASIAFSSLVAATGAHAQSNDLISVTVGMALTRVLQGKVHVAPVQASNRYDRHDARRVAVAGPRGDADRDGVPNRYDRAPNNPRFR